MHRRTELVTQSRNHASSCHFAPKLYCCCCCCYCSLWTLTICVCPRAFWGVFRRDCTICWRYLASNQPLLASIVILGQISAFCKKWSQFLQSAEKLIDFHISAPKIARFPISAKPQWPAPHRDIIKISQIFWPKTPILRSCGDSPPSATGLSQFLTKCVYMECQFIRIWTNW